MKIKNRWTQDIIIEDESEKLIDTLQNAIKKGADLSRANLSRANLSGADLSGADLSGADLYGADLSRANLSRANLSGADLSGADLSRANLSGADLYGADLSGADLSGADLSGADLSGADLYDAKGFEIFPVQILGSGHGIIRTSRENIKIGCIEKPLAEWFENYEQIGQDQGYSEEQIKEYGIYLRMLAELTKEEI